MGDARETVAGLTGRGPGPVALTALHAKYAEMLAMRLEHEAGTEDARRVRARMAALAGRFPGALREIDELELGVIRDRLARLDAVLGGDAAVECWMEAVVTFHTLARGALRAKRWLAGRRTVEAADVEAYHRHLEQLEHADHAAEARVWADELAALAAPPGGRIFDLVFAHLAAALAIPESTARIHVFGRAGRRR